MLRSTLSETGYDVSMRPTLVTWGARALYVGPALNLDAHQNAVAVLAFALDAPMAIASKPDNEPPDYRACWSALIRPNTLHHIKASGAMAFLYLDPTSRDLETVKTLARDVSDRVSLDVCSETELRQRLRDFLNQRAEWRDVQIACERNLHLTTSREIDPRIASAILALRTAPQDNILIADLAQRFGLSASRFQHLFSEAAGLPYRRYRLWCRLTAAVRAAHAGASLTDAAHSAGLTSSAHFSAAFHAMFGLAPSRLNIRAMRFIEA
jgi:AraC-like DNA-binding protein